MKKPLGVISLVVLLCVQILTPVTYAVGDDDFVSETYVEESASEEVVEAADDADEVSDEVSEEDDASEEATEEDSSDEDSQDEDTLEGEEDSADAEESDVLDEEEVTDSEGEKEVSSGSSKESVSEESSVLSEEDEAFIAKLSKQGSVAKIAEKLGINWYTDSSEIAVLAGIEGNYYGTKEQNNIIREYLISHALELLKKNVPSEDVVEEVTVEEAVSSEVESEGLNEEEISGKKYYNGVTVNVLAPVKSFPEGTTLSITPIKKKNELNEIKEQLVDSQEQITEESTVVAFDISFLYSGEEVQPVTGQTVQVTFNYENHEGLTDADHDEEKELKVYHINDKDEEGNKVENISDVTVEEVEIVKNEEGELVVDAESFSIYTIVTQVAEEGPEALEDQLANFEYGEISFARPAGMDVANFPIEGFTIMDRNLGATTNVITKTGSYGYHYQWGNNYGFDSSMVYLDENYLTGNKISVSEGATGYMGKEFVYGSINTWMQVNRDTLWGGEYDDDDNGWGVSLNNSINRQGPCPDGWHVPSAGEWGLLIKYWGEENGASVEATDDPDYNLYYLNGDVSDFQQYFKLPFAGRRSFSVAKAEEKNNGGFYWSSSPLAEPSPLVRNLKITNSTVDAEQFSIPAYGYSVRCFKNEYSGTGDKFTITFDFNGGSGSTAAIHVVSGEKAIEPSEPVKGDKEFLGRFLEGSNTPFDFEEIAITGDITLYAVYSTTVTYNLNGGYWTEEGTSSTLPKPVSYGKEVTTTNWKTPSKQGYMFDGWYVSTESNASRWTGNIENDITVYARWLPFNEKEVVINGVSFKIMDRNLGSSSVDGDGYVFQWGNNYGFKLGGEGVEEFPNGEVITNVKSTDWQNHISTYYNSKWIQAVDAWNFGAGFHDNLWGENSLLDSDKQGPCPDGYHVPSSQEWEGIGTLIKNEDESTYVVGSDVQSFLDLPQSIAINVWYGVGSEFTAYWSSTPDSGFESDALVLDLTEEYDEINHVREKSSGFPVRCFKDTPTKVIHFETNSDTPLADQRGVKWYDDGAAELPEPTRADSYSTFNGWYSTPTFIESTKVTTNDINDSEVTLFAKWSCNGSSVSNEEGTACEQKYTVTFDVDTNEGTTETGSIVLDSENAVIDLNNYIATKLGYTFVGWNTNSGAHEKLSNNYDNYPVSEDTTLYAIFSKTVTITFDVNGNDGENGDSSCTMYNTGTTCQIQSPTISPKANYSVIGWSTANDRYENDWTAGQDKDVSATRTYFAQTKTMPSEYTATFVPGAITESADLSRSCTPDVRYNGQNIDEDCEVTAPSLILKSGYQNGIWKNGNSEYVEGATILLTNDITYTATATPITYTITYVGADGLTTNYVSTYDVEHSVTLQTPSKSGWNFVAWHSGSLEGATVTEIPVGSIGDRTFYAEWVGKTFSATFDANGATISKTFADCTVSRENGTCDVAELPTITRDGFTIKGWSIDANAESGSNVVTLSETNNGTKYYAITEKEVTVKFNGNGNGGTYEDGSCTIRNTETNCSITAPDMIVPSGFIKMGWNTSSEVLEHPEWDGSAKLFTSDATYYAQTKNISSLTATFNGNGNTIDNHKQQVIRECDRYNNKTKCTIVGVPVIDNNPYTDTILGYSKSAATGSAMAQFGTLTLNAATIAGGTADVEIDKNEVLYAQTYKPAVTHTVTYKKGEGNDAKGVISFDPYNRSCTIAAIYNGNNNVEQATGCELVAPEILVANNYAGYWDGPLYSGDVYTVYNDKTLNAYSTGEHYSISFYLGEGGTWPTGVAQQDSYQEGDTVVINSPVWTGYTFIGWTTGSNTVPVKNISIQPTDKGSKLFVAHWQQDEYRIIYSDIEQGTTNLVRTYSYENGATLVAPNKSPMGYHFKGWIGENGDSPEASVTILGGVAGDKYFTAVWEAETYTVIGHLNGGKIGEETSYVFTYDIESGNINLSTPTRDNSTFVGWTGSNGSSPDLNVVISQGSHGDKEYYAVYTCNEGYEANGNTCVLKPYSVTYVLDEGKHTTVNPQETVTRDETSYKINIKNPIKTGYNFLGWTTNIQNATCKEGTTERANCRAESANDLTIEFADGQAVILTAKWAHVPIEVSKQDLIGTTPTGTATVTEYGYDSRIDLAAEAMTGYRTLGWSEGTDGVVKYNDNTKEYVRDLTIVYDNPTAVSGGTGRVSLYSVRELINYTIKYVLNEGVQTNPTTYNVTQANIVLTDAVKTGYVFKGWYDADENKITTITPEVVAELTSPYKLTLTARWETSKNTPYKVYHERQWIDGEYYKTNTERTDVDELTGETDKSVTPARRTNYVGFIMPVDQKTDTIKADGSTEIIYQYEREKHIYRYNTVVGATTKWKRSLDADYTTNATTTQMFFDTPIILSGKADTGYSWSGWNITSGGETTRIVAPIYEFNMPLVNVEVTPVVYHIPYTLKFDVNGGTGDSGDLADVYPIYYDSGITYPVVTRMGYTFLGWYDDAANTRYGSGTEDGNLNMSNSDLTLTAHWQANDFTLNVNHYKMSLSGEYSETPNKIVQIETKIDADLTGTVNTGILPENYTGFTLSGDAVETIHINPDGSSVINYYYSRDRHNVRINENEGVILSGTLSGVYYYGTPVAVEALAKTGYTWSGWNVTSGGETVFNELTGVEFVLSTGDVELTPFVTVNEYHLTVKDGTTIIFSGDVLYKTNISTYLGSLSKNGYTFNGWINRPANDLMPANDLVIEAKWTKIALAGGGGGGGGGSSSSSDTNKDKTPVTTGAQEQEHGSAELTGEVKKVDEPKEEKEEVKSEVKPIENMEFEEIKDINANQLNKVDRKKLTKEQNEILDAYQWAYEHNVTTMVTLRDANPEGVVTRGHLAKMVVNYATNVLGQKIPEKIPSECRWNDYRGDWESREIKDYAVKACALGLMGLDMKKFQPKVWVSRAQFGTIMSRLLWGKKYAGGKPYYRNHLNALKTNGIMTQIGNPEGRTELRQWVWLMLMRAGLEK